MNQYCAKLLLRRSICAGVVSACLAGAQSAALAKARLVPADVMAMWANPNKPAQIVLRAEELPQTGIEIDYTIHDYVDKHVIKGMAPLENGQVTVHVTLPNGYFYIDFPATQQRFGLVSIEPYAGKPDPYFSINSILDWLVKKDQASPSRLDYIKVMKRSGISLAREGFGWSNLLQPTADTWNWNADENYDNLFQDYAKNGIPLLMLLNTAPDHLGKAIGEGSHRFPLDMLAVDNAWRKMTDHWRAAWGAVEIWNEPDGSFGGSAPPDQYGAVAKSMAYAFTQQKSPAQLVGAVAAAGWDEHYYQLVAGNGLLHNMDAWSFHTYGHHTPKTMQTLVQNYRNAFAKDDIASMPLWNSESGSFWFNGADGANSTQDRQSALDITMRGIECLACGVTRYMPFVLPYYEEGPNNWGMMDRNGTPQRSLVAYIRSIELLANRPYVGDWRIGEAPLTRARVFADDKTSVVVLYSEKINVDAAVSIPLPKTGVEILGIDGRKLTLMSDGRVPIPDGLTYLRISGPIKEWLNTDTPAMALYQVGRQTPPRRSEPSPIVLQYRPDQTDYFDPDPTGYRIKESAPEVIPFRIDVNNLSDKPQQAVVHIEGDGMRLPDKRVELLPRTVTTLTWDVHIDMAKRGGLQNIDLKVLATSSTANHVDPMMIRFRGVPTVTSLLSQFKAKRKFSILDLKRWEPSALPGTQTTITVPEFETWQLAMNFNDVKDRWSYPHLGVPAEVNIGKYKGVVFDGLCRNEAPAVRVAVWAWQPDGTLCVFMTGNLIPSDNKWHAVYAPFASFTPMGNDNAKLVPSKIAMISFGMNSGVAMNELRVRNVWFVGD